MRFLNPLALTHLMGGNFIMHTLLIVNATYLLYRKYQDAYTDCYLGYNSDLAARADLSFAPRNSSGVVVRSISIRVNIECNIWAWDQMPIHIFRWAWASRGLVDIAQMASANDMTEAEMIVSLETAEHTDEAFSLRELPTLAPPSLSELYNHLAPGEVKYCWPYTPDGVEFGRERET